MFFVDGFSCCYATYPPYIADEVPGEHKEILAATSRQAMSTDYCGVDCVLITCQDYFI